MAAGPHEQSPPSMRPSQHFTVTLRKITNAPLAIGIGLGLLSSHQGIICTIFCIYPLVNDKATSMRVPSYLTVLRSFYAFANTTASFGGAFPHRALQPLSRGTILKSMPTIPFLGSLFSSSSSRDMSFPIEKSDGEWQAVLSKEQFRILREKGTEAPYTGKYDKHMPTSGLYTCAGCNTPLYRANHKFKSGCGWPAFYDAVPGAVTRHTDRTLGMSRTEIVCSKCGGHLGHVFKGEGYPTPIDERHCVNSVSLNFSKDDPVEGGQSSESKA